MSEPEMQDPENPEWLEHDFAQARPASEILGAELAGALVRDRHESLLHSAFLKQPALARGFRIAA